MKTYKVLLGTCTKSKKTAYLNTICTKSASKDSLKCFVIFGSSACQGRHVFPDMYSSPILPNKYPGTNVNLVIT